MLVLLEHALIQQNTTSKLFIKVYHGILYIIYRIM